MVVGFGRQGPELAAVLHDVEACGGGAFEAVRQRAAVAIARPDRRADIVRSGRVLREPPGRAGAFVEGRRLVIVGGAVLGVGPAAFAFFVPRAHFHRVAGLCREAADRGPGGGDRCVDDLRPWLTGRVAAVLVVVVVDARPRVGGLGPVDREAVQGGRRHGGLRDFARGFEFVRDGDLDLRRGAPAVAVLRGDGEVEGVARLVVVVDAGAGPQLTRVVFEVDARGVPSAEAVRQRVEIGVGGGDRRTDGPVRRRVLGKRPGQGRLGELRRGVRIGGRTRGLGPGARAVGVDGAHAYLVRGGRSQVRQRRRPAESPVVGVGEVGRARGAVVDVVVGDPGAGVVPGGPRNRNLRRRQDADVGDGRRFERRIRHRDGNGVRRSAGAAAGTRGRDDGDDVDVVAGRVRRVGGRDVRGPFVVRWRPETQGAGVVDFERVAVGGGGDRMGAGVGRADGADLKRVLRYRETRRGREDRGTYCRSTTTRPAAAATTAAAPAAPAAPATAAGGPHAAAGRPRAGAFGIGGAYADLVEGGARQARDAQGRGGAIVLGVHEVLAELPVLGVVVRDRGAGVFWRRPADIDVR